MSRINGNILFDAGTRVRSRESRCHAPVPFGRVWFSDYNQPVPMGREKASTFWGACGAIRRDVFIQMSGFDERYWTPWGEHIELGSRLVQHGYTIRLHKELQVKHLKRWG